MREEAAGDGARPSHPRQAGDAPPLAAASSSAPAPLGGAALAASGPRWDLLWGAAMPPDDYARAGLLPRHRVNHLPGTWELGRKDRLYRALARARRRPTAAARDAPIPPVLARTASADGGLARRAAAPPGARPPAAPRRPPPSLGAAGPGGADRAPLPPAAPPPPSGSAPAPPAPGPASRPRGWSPFDLCPSCFHLPEEAAALRAAVARRPGALWIRKPPGSSRGRGVRLVQNVASAAALRRAVLVQEYVSDPMTLYGRKFDLRIYVAVTGLAPLRAYVFDEGLVRLAAKPFTLAKSKRSDRAVHVTNVAVQTRLAAQREAEAAAAAEAEAERAADGDDESRSDAGSDAEGSAESDGGSDVGNDGVDDGRTGDGADPPLVGAGVAPPPPPLGGRDGLKWTLAQLRAHLATLDDAPSWETIWARICDTVACALLAVEPRLVSIGRGALPSGGGGQAGRGRPASAAGRPSSAAAGPGREAPTLDDTCFELFGFDVMFDSSHRPWLLEVNTGPSLAASHPADVQVKFPLLADLLHLVGVPAGRGASRVGDAGPGGVGRTSDREAAAPRLSLSACADPGTALGDVPLRSLPAPIRRVAAELARSRATSFRRVLPPDPSHGIADGSLAPATGVNESLRPGTPPGEAPAARRPPRGAQPVSTDGRLRPLVGGESSNELRERYLRLLEVPRRDFSAVCRWDEARERAERAADRAGGRASAATPGGATSRGRSGGQGHAEPSGDVRRPSELPSAPSPRPSSATLERDACRTPATWAPAQARPAPAPSASAAPASLAERAIATAAVYGAARRGNPARALPPVKIPAPPTPAPLDCEVPHVDRTPWVVGRGLSARTTSSSVRSTT